MRNLGVAGPVPQRSAAPRSCPTQKQLTARATEATDLAASLLAGCERKRLPKSRARDTPMTCGHHETPGPSPPLLRALPLRKPLPHLLDARLVLRFARRRLGPRKQTLPCRAARKLHNASDPRCHLGNPSLLVIARCTPADDIASGRPLSSCSSQSLITATRASHCFGSKVLKRCPTDPNGAFIASEEAVPAKTAHDAQLQSRQRRRQEQDAASDSA
jgi:hypothetical protein